MAYANTSDIKLKKFATENDAINFLKKMVTAHGTDLTKRWKKGPLDYSFFNHTSEAKSKVRKFRAAFIGLYESDIINEVRRNLRPEIERELKKIGNTNTGSLLDHDILEIEGDLIKGIEQTRPKYKQVVKSLLNSVNGKWWVRRNVERDRIAAACSIFDGTGKVETSDLNENPFGDGTDKPILDEEYCFICEKLIAENDKTVSFSGTDFIACSNYCYSKGHGSKMDENGKYPHFHNCSTCNRWIPKTVGDTCRTCQEKNQERKTGKCFTCHNNKPIAGRKSGTNQEYCQECLNKIPKCEVCGKRCWGKSNNAPGTKFESKWEGKSFFFNSQDCFNKWEKEKKNPPKPNLAQLRIKYLNELAGLQDWDLLTEDEKDKFKNMIRNGFSEFDFKNAILKAKILIDQRKKEKGDDGGDGDGNDKNLPAEIQKAIREIEAELNKEPKITEKEQENFNWKDYIENSKSISELKSRNEEILNQIREARKQKLNHFLENVIQEIKTELARPPEIENSELSNPNWETELNPLTEKSQIENLRDTILAEITQKREVKEIGSQLDQLISSAQAAANNKEWEKLKGLLKRINYYQDSRIYEDKKATIKELENKLATGDFAKYQEENISSLEDFLNKGEKIDPNELSEKNRNFQDRIKTAKNQEEVDKIVEEVQDEVGTNKAEKVVNKLFEKAKTTDTDQQKSDFRQKVNLLKNGNKWERKVYEKYKDEFEKILASWANSDDNNNSPVQSHPDGSDKGLSKPLIYILVIAIIGAVICGLLVIRNKLKGSG